MRKLTVHTPDSIRKAAVAGMFYPGSAPELAADLESMFAQAARPVPGERPIALVAPHAGYVYSGQTAAGAYALLEGIDVATVVVVSPSHREYFPGVTVYPGDGYETPLGLVNVDTAMRDRLLSGSKIVKASRAGHGAEHAVEVHLPFLQKVLGSFLFLPLVMGDQSRETCYSLGEVLGEILQDTSTLLVASTDLSHFHPAGEAERRDRIVLGDLESFAPERLMSDIEEGLAEACGGGPLVAVMVAARSLGASSLRVLAYTHSGNVTGENDSVVGYCSAVMSR
jgi:AmmeMemoRadiSam system protein B